MINKCEVCEKEFYCARGRTVCSNKCRRTKDINKQKLKELIKETNEKFIARIESMLYGICGCDKKRGRRILEECLKRNYKRKH